MHSSGAVIFEQYRLRRAGWQSAVGHIASSCSLKVKQKALLLLYAFLGTFCCLRLPPLIDCEECPSHLAVKDES